MPTPPPDPLRLAQLQGQANLAYQQALAQIGQQRGNMLRDYGYEGNFDAQGNLTGMRVSANNPYGRYQQMLRGHAMASDQADYGGIASGLRGGVINSALSQLRTQQGGEAADLGTSMSRGFQDLLENQRQAETTHNNALQQAEQDAIQSAIEQQQFNQADYSGLDYPGYGEDPLGGTDENTGMVEPPYGNESGGSGGGYGHSESNIRRRLAQQVRNRRRGRSNRAQQQAQRAASRQGRRSRGGRQP